MNTCGELSVIKVYVVLSPLGFCDVCNWRTVAAVSVDLSAGAGHNVPGVESQELSVVSTTAVVSQSAPLLSDQSRVSGPC